MDSFAGEGIASSRAKVLEMVESSWSGERARRDEGNGAGILVVLVFVLGRSVSVW